MEATAEGGSKRLLSLALAGGILAAGWVIGSLAFGGQSASAASTDLLPIGGPSSPVAALVTDVSHVTTPIVTPLVSAVTPVLAPVAPVIHIVVPVVAAVTTPVGHVVAPVLSPVLKPVLAPIVRVVSPLVSTVTPLLEPLVPVVDEVLAPVLPLVDAVLPPLGVDLSAVVGLANEGRHSAVATTLLGAAGAASDQSGSKPASLPFAPCTPSPGGPVPTGAVGAAALDGVISSGIPSGLGASASAGASGDALPSFPAYETDTAPD